jgi:ubiquinone/menaquinone biosynthesis C-methylase UbiE
VEWNPATYNERFGIVTRSGSGLVELLKPLPGERILDVGCGTGALTAQIASAGAEVIGIDESANMIAEARHTHPELRFEVMDARDLSFRAEFDAVFSNAALHWMQPPEAVVRGLAAALKPSGRFVAEFGGKGNIQAVTTSVGFHAWYFPSLAQYSTLLERHGFEVTAAMLFDRPTPFTGEDGLRDWLDTFYMGGLDGATVDRVMRELRPSLFREDAWWIDYRRLRVMAVREPAAPDAS